MPTGNSTPVWTDPQDDKVPLALPFVVRDLMTVDLVTVLPSAPVKQIAAEMIDHDVHAVPVLDEGGRLVGVVSEADLIVREGFPTVRSHTLAGAVSDVLDEHRHHWQHRSAGLTAADVMTSDVVTCSASEPVPVATRRMLRHGLRFLPVVDEDRVVGILSGRDLLRALQQPDSEIRERLASLLHDPLWMPEQHRVTSSVENGVVTLSGSVQYRSDTEVVRDVVRHLPGVVQVIDELTWRHPDPNPSYLHDTDLR